MELNQPDWTCRMELPGWWLYFAEVRLTQDFEPVSLARAMDAAADAFRRDQAGRDLATHPVLSAIRELFKQAGTSPSRYRPSSEALARRVLNGESLPRIQPLVDLNNLLSLRTLLPCCVMKPGSVVPPLVFRAGRAGESLTGLRGSLELEGKPVLADSLGPFGTPITDDHRVILESHHREALLLAYVPQGVAVDPGARLRGLILEIGGVEITYETKG